MIVDAVRHRATQANPDRDERVRRLDQQIAELQSERDRVAAGRDRRGIRRGHARGLRQPHRLDRPAARRLQAGGRVVATMHRQIVNDFRAEDRPVGEVLDEYLAKTDALMSLTAEGRAFEGAFELLRDDALLLDLKGDLETILSHPFAAQLKPVERRSFGATVTLIRSGIDDVLTQRNGLTTTLREHIVNHDIVKDRDSRACCATSTRNSSRGCRPRARSRACAPRSCPATSMPRTCASASTTRIARSAGRAGRRLAARARGAEPRRDAQAGRSAAGGDARGAGRRSARGATAATPPSVTSSTTLTPSCAARSRSSDSCSWPRRSTPSRMPARPTATQQTQHRAVPDGAARRHDAHLRGAAHHPQR